MLFVVLFWVAVFLIVMRLMTWVARNHPKARNAAALVVEFGAAFAIAEAVSDAAAIASGSSDQGRLIVNAVLFALVGATAHFFASNTARSPLVVGLPFVLVGAAVLLGMVTSPGRTLVGAALLGLGVILGLLKARQGRDSARANESGEVVQA